LLTDIAVEYIGKRRRGEIGMEEMEERIQRGEPNIAPGPDGILALQVRR
jgi:hypothetical protein